MMRELSIELFGNLHIVYRGESVKSVKKTRVQELLAWLLLNRSQPQSRQEIAFSFWPDCSDKQAMTNLRNALYYLKKNLPDSDPCLQIDQKTIQWNREASCYLDVADFEQSLKAADIAEKEGRVSEKISCLEHAVGLYKGRLLESSYAEWIEPKRQKFEEEYLYAITLLVDQFEENRNYDRAIDYSKKWIASDPYLEDAWHRLIHLHVLSGNRSLALQAYSELEQFLQREMGISPSKPTRDLIERIRSDSYPTENSSRSGKTSGKDENWKFVGRKKEWDDLIESWKQVLSGDEPGMILLKGEPGIGKSRLAAEFKNYLGKQGYRVVSTRSYASAGMVNYGMVIDCLRDQSALPLLNQLDTIWLNELQRLLPELKLEQPALSEYESEPESPIGFWSHRRLLEAITQVFTHNQKPKALLLDNLQWCDSESIAWLDFLLHQEKSDRLLIVGTARPVELALNQPVKKVLAALHQEQKLKEIELGPLDKTDSMELTRAFAGSDTDDKITDYVYRETEGNPLFIVEFLRKEELQHVLKTDSKTEGDESTREPSTPERIHLVINNRLQNLSAEARELMEMAAAIGREFPFVILLDVSGLTLKELADRLDEMMHHHIIREKNAHVFDFTHDKLREVAYANISWHRKTLYHKRIAESYIDIYSDRLDEYSSRLAFHFEKAGEYRKAVSWYEKAAKNARNLLSKQDVTFYQQAIKLLDKLPEDEKRYRLERDLQAGLAVSLLHLREHKADEVVSACERVRTICKKLGEAPAAPILFSFAMAKLLTGELSDAFDTGKEMFGMAKKSGDDIARVKACYVVGGSLLYLKGDIVNARPYLEEGLRYYDPKHHKTYMKMYDLDAGLVLQAANVSLKWMQGQDAEAEELSDHAYKTAMESKHPFNIVYMYYMKCWWMVLLGKEKEANRYLQKFIELKTTDYELFHWSLHSKVFLGWAKARLGSPENGIELMQEGISELQKYRFIPDLPYYFGLLSEIWMGQGKIDPAMKLVDQAIKFMETWDVRFPEAEIYRIRGELKMLQNPDQAAPARADLEKAVRIAKQQGTTLFEKRAAKQLNSLKTPRPA